MLTLPSLGSHQQAIILPFLDERDGGLKVKGRKGVTRDNLRKERKDEGCVRESVCVRARARAALEEHSPDTEPERKLSGPGSQRGIGGSGGQADKQIRLSAGDGTRSAKTYLEVLLHRLHLRLTPRTKIHRARRCPPLLLCEEKPES